MDTAAAAEADTNRTGVDTFGTGGVQRGGSDATEAAGVDAGLTAREGIFLGVDSGACRGESGGEDVAFFLCDFLAGVLLGVSTEVLGDTTEAEEAESDAAGAAGATLDAAVTAVRSFFTSGSNEGVTPLKAWVIAEGS